jgi:hypothetical protein
MPFMLSSPTITLREGACSSNTGRDIEAFFANQYGNVRVWNAMSVVAKMRFPSHASTQ